MASEEQALFDLSSSEKDTDLSEIDNVQEEGRKRQRSRGQRGGRRQRGRGRGRGRGAGRVQKGGGGQGNTTRADKATAELQRKKEQLREIVNQMSEAQVREMLIKTAERQPALILDFLGQEQFQPDNSHPPPNPNGPNLPEWCICGNCRPMPTEAERLCCGKAPAYCVSRLPDFNLLVMDEAVLALARLYRQDILGLAEDDFNRGNRHAAYRQFIMWQHGRLGAGVRMVVPSCCVWTIRDKYPDQYGQYTGFRPGRLG